MGLQLRWLRRVGVVGVGRCRPVGVEDRGPHQVAMSG